MKTAWGSMEVQGKPWHFMAKCHENSMGFKGNPKKCNGKKPWHFMAKYHENYMGFM